MFILEVAPLIAIPRNQTQILSYFHGQRLPAGSLVEVDIRSKKIPAIVLRSEPLQALKIKLKKESEFELKPINKVLQEKPLLSTAQLNTALWLSAKYFAPLGLCLRVVLPPFFLKQGQTDIRSSLVLPKGSTFEEKSQVSFLQTKNLQNHHKLYEEMISENLNTQILLLAPELTHLQYFYGHYKKFGPHILHSGIKTKDFQKIYRKAASGQPIFVISTRVGAFLPFKNLKLIMVDDESNETYHSDSTPKYNTYDLARFLSKEYGAKLVINDLLPRLETYYEFRPKLSTEHPTVNFVDLVGEIKSGNFSIFSKVLQENLIEAAGHNGKVLILVPRRGYAPVLSCRNCFQPVKCLNCDMVMTIHESGGGQKILKCRKCQNLEKIPSLCPNCRAQRDPELAEGQIGLLEYKGLGIEKAAEKARKLFKDRGLKAPEIFNFSSDLAKNRKEEEKILKDFQKSKSAVLISTQKIFSYKYLLKFDLTAILNLESVAGFPDFRTDERALRTLFALSQMSKHFIIQGYRADYLVLRTFLENQPEKFLEEELANRKNFGYPPFVDLIKLTYTGREQARVFIEIKFLLQKFSAFVASQKLQKEVAVVSNSEVKKEKSRYFASIILKVRNLKIKERNNLLRLVPSQNWKIEIDPLNLF